MSAEDDAYVLGTQSHELERLQLQHSLWRPAAEEAWDRAGLSPGQRVLDLGAGPGFAAVDLARRVGPQGQVLALERSETYVAAARAVARQQNLPQLEVRQHDLLRDPLPHGPNTEPDGGFDLVWCRWVAMFLPTLEPLVEQLPQALCPNGVLVLQEYMHWDTFALHPHGQSIRRFGQVVQASFRAAGGNPDVNRQLPTLLARQGLKIRSLQALPVVGGHGSMAARWMQRFVEVYGLQLIAQGLWSAEEQTQAALEMSRVASEPGSFWVGPTVLEVTAGPA